jgi:glycosyltransferase involved in cell wall biosynthesis
MVLSIIIPSKNEENYIKGVLNSIKNSYLVSDEYEIIIADDSTDNTIDIIKSFDLGIKIVPGGPTPVARNNGASVAKGDYLLFIDSDVSFTNKNLINNLIYELKNYDLVTCNLKCSNDKLVGFIYRLNNFIQKLSKLDKKPFSTGAFMGFNKKLFFELGGFNPEYKHCEDYMLSKKVDPNRFSILDGFIYTDNRRFIKMGYWGMVKYFIKNTLNRDNEDYFKKEIGYW